MKYPSKLLAGYEKFYRRLNYHHSQSKVIIDYEDEIYSIAVVNYEVHHRTELGLKLIKRIKELGLR
jgi:hypothetical protein